MIDADDAGHVFLSSQRSRHSFRLFLYNFEQDAGAALRLAAALLPVTHGGKSKTVGLRERFLRETKTKSRALQEIIAGNELFKKSNQAQVAAFKQAHGNQSPQTRQIVAGVRTNTHGA